MKANHCLLLPFPTAPLRVTSSSSVLGNDVKHTTSTFGYLLLKKCCQATTKWGGAKSTLFNTMMADFFRSSVMYLYRAGGKCSALKRIQINVKFCLTMEPTEIVRSARTYTLNVKRDLHYGLHVMLSFHTQLTAENYARYLVQECL